MTFSLPRSAATPTAFIAATLCLTACGAVLRCSLPPSPFSRAAICLAGPATSFALTALANPLGAYRLAGASALLGLFNLFVMLVLH